MDGLSMLMVVLALLTVKSLLDGCNFPIPSRAHLSHVWPVITNEAHPAFSGARIHSNNTAEMTAMFEALSFLGPRGPVAHEERSRIF